MEGDTKERILRTALALFADRGYAGTSVSDIAGALGLSKAALYRHYAGKQAILESIVARMEARDREKAQESGVPQDAPDGDAQAYRQTPPARLCAFTKAMFRYWTQDPFASAFRRLLTLEQYHDNRMAQLLRQYLSQGPLEYVQALLSGVEEDAHALALAFYGPVYLLYSVYDGAADRQRVTDELDAYVDGFAVRWEGTEHEG